MSIWFFIVLVIGVGYALNRLTSTTDLPVSVRLAEAREIVERGRQARGEDPGTSAPAPATPPPPVAVRYCSTPSTGRRTSMRSRHLIRH